MKCRCHIPDPARDAAKTCRTQPASRPRARDIARAAGVSTATVDRVLNRRLGVRAATAQRVVEAAAALDYLPRAALYEALRPKPMRLVVPAAGGHQPLSAHARRAHLGLGRSARSRSTSPAIATSSKASIRKRSPRACAITRAAPKASPSWRSTIRWCATRSREIAARGIPVLTHDLRHPGHAAHRLCGSRQPRRRPHRRPADRPLRRRAARQGRADRRQPQLSRPRGARDGLPRHHRGGVSGAHRRRLARRSRRRGAELPPDPRAAGPASRHRRHLQYRRRRRTASRGRCARPIAAPRWRSSATG